MPAPFLSQTQGPTVNEALLVTQTAYQLANPQNPPTLVEVGGRGGDAGFRCSVHRPGPSGEPSGGPSQRAPRPPSHLVPCCVVSGATFCLRHKSRPDLQRPSKHHQRTWFKCLLEKEKKDKLDSP